MTIEPNAAFSAGAAGSILMPPRQRIAAPECARPRAQQYPQADHRRNTAAHLADRSLLRPGTGALRWQCEDAPAQPVETGPWNLELTPGIRTNTDTTVRISANCSPAVTLSLYRLTSRRMLLNHFQCPGLARKPSEQTRIFPTLPAVTTGPQDNRTTGPQDNKTARL